MSLFIHKVPTIVSISQMLEDEDVPGQFCSPDLPIRECHGRQVPTIWYPFTECSNPRKARSFGQLNLACIESGLSRIVLSQGHLSPPSSTKDSLSDGGGSSPISSDQTTESVDGPFNTSLAEKVLRKEWDRRFEQGLFRYDVRECETKSTAGAYGFIAQLNEGRATKKRPTEFRVDCVCQPFDASKFNFCKAATKEVLFQFSAGPVTETRYRSSAPCGASPNLVLINISPIEYGHVLLVPRVNDCIPQVVDQTAMLFALQCANALHNPFFRLGYNSLGAFGTINHLHFQGYFLPQPYPVERAPTIPIAGLPEKVRGVLVERLQAYPVEGWVFSGSLNLDSMASLVGALCMQLQHLDVPHNLLICDMGARVILWPQCYAAKQARGEVPTEVLDMGVNPAAFEIAGHMVLKRREDYEGLTQEKAWAMLQWVSLTVSEIDALQWKLFAKFLIV